MRKHSGAQRFKKKCPIRTLKAHRFLLGKIGDLLWEEGFWKGNVHWKSGNRFFPLICKGRYHFLWLLKTGICPSVEEIVKGFTGERAPD